MVRYAFLSVVKVTEDDVMKMAQKNEWGFDFTWSQEHLGLFWHVTVYTTE